MVKFILGPDVTSDLAGLTRQPALWSRARGHIDALRLYAQCLYQDSSENGAGGVADNYYEKLVAAGFFAQLAAWNLPIDVEGPAIKFWDGTGCDGVQPTRLLLLAIERARAAGWPIRNISLDEPLQATECGLTLEQTAEGTARVIAAVRDANHRNVDLTFVYYTPAADIIRFTEIVQQYGAPLGQWTSPTGIDLDFDLWSLRHVSTSTVRREIKLLQSTCHAWGIPLRVILTSNHEETPEGYRTELLAGFRMVRELLGGDPDAYILESWKGTNTPVNLPEANRLAHTGLVNEVAQLVEAHP